MEPHPKKSLGQHWLKDEAALRAILDAAMTEKNDVILEIGPGLGSLTRLLLTRVKRVVAVELDKALAAQLPKRIRDKNLDVINQDIMNFDLSVMPPGYKIVANIPYYLTSGLLRILTEADNPPKQIVLLVQKEVAERLAARPGNMSLLSVAVQLYYEASLGPVIAAKMFTPPPKVDSRLIILKRRPKPLFEDLDTRKFFQLVKAGFSEKRKKLRSSLAGGLNISKSDADDMLAGSEVNGDLRAEALSLDQWHWLYMEYIVKTDLRSLL